METERVVINSVVEIIVGRIGEDVLVRLPGDGKAGDSPCQDNCFVFLEAEEAVFLSALPEEEKHLIRELMARAFSLGVCSTKEEE